MSKAIIMFYLMCMKIITILLCFSCHRGDTKIIHLFSKFLFKLRGAVFKRRATDQKFYWTEPLSKLWGAKITTILQYKSIV